MAVSEIRCRVLQLTIFCLCMPTLLAALSHENSTIGRDQCDWTTSNYEDLRSTFLAHNFTLRLSVDSVNGSNDTACLNGSRPCRTLNYALCQEAANCPNSRNDSVVSFRSLEVYLAPGRHRLTSRLRLRNSSFIHIYGDSSQETFLMCAQDFPNQQFPCVFDNLDFFQSSHIWLSGITITHCGPVAAGVFMRRVSNVIVQNCTFTQNAGPGLSVSAQPDRLYLVDNIIHNNTGLSLPANLSNRFCNRLRDTAFSRFRAGGSGGFDLRADEFTKEVLLLRNKFIDNSAVPDFSDSTIPASRRPFGRGGAMSIGMLGSSDCHVCIKDTVVRGNHARLAAGGVSLYLTNKATGNSVTILDSIVEDNWCDSTECFGGGVYFTTDGQVDDTTINTMYVYDTLFRNNSAGTGGGFLGVLYSSESGYFLTNSTFLGNKGRFDGSALVVLSMASVNRGGNDLYCFNCHFENNTVMGESLVDVAAVRLYRVRLTLNSTTDRPTFFSNNTGGGLDITQGRVDVVTMVTFEGNTAISGAAMRLFGQTEVFLAPGSTLTFAGNHADRLGGAMFVLAPPNQIEPRFRLNACFLQSGITPFMDLPPQQWNVTVSFHGNSANEGGSAIYSTDFEYCCWLGQENDTNDIPDCSSALVFVPHPGYQPPFEYRHSNGTAITEKKDIINLLATASQHITAEPQALAVLFGETVQTKVSLTDTFNHSLSAVFSAEAGKLELTQSLGSSSHNHDDPYVFDVEGPAILSDLRNKCANSSRITSTGEICQEKVKDSVKFSIFAEQGQSEQDTTVTLDISQCNPGYAFDRNSSTCVCRNVENYEYRQFSCERKGRFIYVPDGTAVNVSDDAELYFAFVPLSYLNCTRSREVANLPVCEIRFANLSDQCAVGRTGTLCGTCKTDEGFCLSMDLQYCLQQSNSWLGIVCYLAICVFAVIGCIVILYFNIGVPNELRGFFFYAQVIGVVFRNFRLSSQEGIGKFFDFLLNLLGTTLPFPLCIGPWLQATWVAFLGYIPPLLALATVCIFVLSARCVRRLSNRSTLSGITLIILLFYKYLTDSSFFFMSCLRLQDGVDYVNRFTGQPCFSAPHVELFVFSILITLSIVAPLPFFFMVITCKHFKRTMHFSDALSKGMRVRFRWYAAWDILRRVLFVVVALLPGIIIPHRLLALLFFEVVMLVVHCLSKPYEAKWINVVEALILLDLFVATAAILQRQDRYIPRWLGSVVVILPFVYAAAVGAYLVGKYLWAHCLAAKWKERLFVFLSPTNWKSPFPSRSGADEEDRSAFYASHLLNESDELPWLPRMAPRVSRTTRTDNWDRQALFQESLLSHDDED